MTLVLGLDVGGTASRALVSTVDGTRVGFGRAGAGNPVTVPAREAAANVRAALTAALSAVDASEVRAAVVGAAGASRPALFHEVMPALGIRCPVRVVDDVVVAFAAGASSGSGNVLISGTGAVAAEVRGERTVRIADGLGWLLGDLGSGFWLGRAAATATARSLYRGEPPSPLTGSVADAVGESDPDSFVVALHRRPPRQLAALAPLVTRAARAGDPVALSIVDEAVRHLAGTVGQVREPGDRRPIVLAGGVLRGCAPLRDRLRRLLAAAWPGAAVSLAEPGEVGAARLAAMSVSAATAPG